MVFIDYSVNKVRAFKIEFPCLLLATVNNGKRLSCFV